MEELHLERADLRRLPSLDGVQLDLAVQPAARKLDFQQAAGQRRGVDGCVDLLQHVVDGAGVVFVTMGDDDPGHFLAVVAADIGNRG